METVTINATLSSKKRSEFYQSMESLTGLVKEYVHDFELKFLNDSHFIIKITFEGMEQLEENFYRCPLTILKGTVKSLCKNTVIRINGVITDSS